jgi:hypothetical protein
MASNRPPKKPPPPDPQRSGKPAPKGKGRAKAPTPEAAPEVDDQADQTWQGVTFSDDEPPMYEGKKKRKQQLKAEAEEAMAWETPPVCKDVWGTAQQAEPIEEEVNRFLSYRNDPRMDLDIEIASLSVKTSEASQLMSLWSASSEQYLQPPREEGHSSSASSKASKRRRSPLLFRRSQESCTSNQGRGDFLEARQPPGQHCRSPAQEENLLLREEVQCLCKYRRQDQMRINFLQRQLAAEQQLGHAEGLAQAAQIQLHSPPTDCEYGRGRPSGRDYDNDYARDGRILSNLPHRELGPRGAAPPHHHDHTLRGCHPQPPPEAGSKSYPTKHARHRRPTNWS